MTTAPPWWPQAKPWPPRLSRAAIAMLRECRTDAERAQPHPFADRRIVFKMLRDGLLARVEPSSLAGYWLAGYVLTPLGARVLAAIEYQRPALKLVTT